MTDDDPADAHIDEAPRSAAGDEPSALGELSSQVLARVVASMGGSRREGQETMVEAICRAVDTEHRLVIQAGTGTGKSVGYLVPALVQCATAGARVVVSTATLALQRQIVVKDAPTVAAAVEDLTGRRLEIALLKGWNNYLCKHRVAGGYPDEGTLFDAGPATGLGKEVIELRAWAEETDSGDRDDLVPGPSERAWRQVSVSKRECLGKSCPMVEECFAQIARERAADADLVVTNHTLLGIHATTDSDLFGEVDLVIVDEAHELAERVRAQAAASLSAGQLARISRSARTHAKVDTTAMDQAASEIDIQLDDMPAGLLDERPEGLDAAIRSLDAAVRDAYTQVQESGADAAGKALARGALDEALAACAAWGRSPEDSITWVERDATDTSRHAELVVAPLDVAPAIGTVALGEGAAVLTSATLTMGGSFEPIAYECGLMVSPVPWDATDVGTPFDVAAQGIVYVARHLPDPGPLGPSEEALDELVELVQASGGGALALFSSWKGAQAGAQALRERTDLRILVQGEESAASLIQQFREDVDSCLVGTLGLWQGVDVPGPSCRLVTIDRIPFPHPDDPVAKALSRDAQKRRRSGFWTVSVPRASLLMAQGAGRLLRTSNDRGIVAVLDRRLVTKSYGAAIRASMPAMWPTIDGTLVRGALRRLAASAKGGRAQSDAER